MPKDTLFDDATLKRVMLKMFQSPTADVAGFCNTLGLNPKEFIAYLKDDTRNGDWLREVLDKVGGMIVI
jgi:hypothetical protein